MEGMEFVVAIVAIVFGSKLIRDLAYAKRGITPGKKGKAMSCALCAEDNGASVANELAKIEKLEERIKVLERIATDKPSNLASEIDRL